MINNVIYTVSESYMNKDHVCPTCGVGTIKGKDLTKYMVKGRPACADCADKYIGKCKEYKSNEKELKESL